MIIKRYLLKLYLWLVMRDDPRFKFSREWQEKKLWSFDEPHDDFDRSFYQFECQKALKPGTFILANILSPWLILFDILTLSLFRLSATSTLNRYSIVCLLNGIDERMVPEELLLEFDHPLFLKNLSERKLIGADLRWLARLWLMKPTQAFFIYKIFTKMVRYRYIIDKFSPKVIATHSEYSCTSSIMTTFCSQNDVLHVGFMHGEKPFYIRDSFFRFDRMYVFDAHYTTTFGQLRAGCNDFSVAIPPQFLVSSDSDPMVYDFCYYLAAEGKEALKIIFAALSSLVSLGYKVKVRCHPRWTNLELVDTFGCESDIEVEDCNISIDDSICSTRYVVALFSTVLFQASLMRRVVVVDNLSSRSDYDKLLELNCLFLTRDHRLLTEFVKS